MTRLVVCSLTGKAATFLYTNKCLLCLSLIQSIRFFRCGISTQEKITIIPTFNYQAKAFLLKGIQIVPKYKLHSCLMTFYIVYFHF